MEVFEVVIALLLGGAALAALARRIGAPYPALVALAGAALALIPGVPTLVLDPELALALFVAPVLVDAAFDSSPRDLRAALLQPVIHDDRPGPQVPAAGEVRGERGQGQGVGPAGAGHQQQRPLGGAMGGGARGPGRGGRVLLASARPPPGLP